jgi:urea transporter
MNEGQDSVDLQWPRVILRGIGQVMFQGHAGTGALFLAGLVLASPWMALAAFLAAGIGTLTAGLLQLDRQEISQGLYGFNSALVGIALVTFLELRPATWILLLAGSVVATLVTWVCRRKLPFPVYTAPFIVVTWGSLLLVDWAAADLRRPASPTDDTPASFVSSVLAGEAEVMFGATAGTGLCFLVGIALSNPHHALAALVGSLLGTLTAVYRHDPQASIWIGLYGYNASLAAMAAYLARPGLVAPVLAAIVTVPIVDWADAAWSVPALTAPFVLAAWLVLLLLAAEKLASPAQS